MVGWLGDNGGEGGGWEWRYLIPCSYYFLPALSVRLSQQVFFVHSFRENPYLFLMWAVWFRCAGGLHNKGRSCVWFCNWVPNADRRSFFVLLRITTTMGHRQMG